MKYISFLSLFLFTGSAYSQKMVDNVNYNKFTEVTGTNYVIATFEDWSKKGTYNNHLLFINTTNDQRTKVDFPKHTYFEKIEQIRIDSFSINKVLVALRTDYADNRKIDFRIRPQKIIMLSTDGREKIELTADNFFVSNWVVNSYAGTVTIVGFIDANANGKYDREDKNDILLFDLKTLKPISKNWQIR